MAVPADVRQFAPVFVFHPKEKYWPSSIGDYVRNCKLVATEDKSVIMDPIANPADIMKYDVPSAVALSLKTDVPDRKTGYSPNKRSPLYPSPPEVYSVRHTLTYTSAATGTYAATELTYCLWFPYNGTASPHSSDREYITIRLRDGKPVGVFFSNHSGGYWKRWKDVALQGGRPVVFVAAESHAMFHAPGTVTRVFGFGNDLVAPLDKGVVMAPSSYVIVPMTDPSRPYIRWKGDRDADNFRGRPMLMDGQFFVASKPCPVTDTLGLAKSALSPTVRIAILAALAVVALLVVALGLYFHKAWLAALAALPTAALALMYVVVTADDVTGCLNNNASDLVEEQPEHAWKGQYKCPKGYGWGWDANAGQCCVANAKCVPSIPDFRA